MQMFVQLQSWGLLVVLLFVVVFVKGRGAGSWRALVGSIVLVALSALHVGFLSNIESVLAILVKHGTVSLAESENTKATVALWNVLAPLIAGGVGVNLFTSWLTFVPKASVSERQSEAGVRPFI